MVCFGFVPSLRADQTGRGRCIAHTKRSRRDPCVLVNSKLSPFCVSRLSIVRPPLPQLTQQAAPVLLLRLHGLRGLHHAVDQVHEPGLLLFVRQQEGHPAFSRARS